MRKCILIVDDNPKIRQIVRSVLEAQPECTVCGEASNGQDAIEKAAQLHPDLVVLDLVMPLLNGLEVARVLSKTMPNVPLVMLTNHANKLIEPEARAAGIRAVLSKEDGMQELAELCLELVH
ncbi:MAG TPA: response regulator transcription factor [Candidatus Dormibacteraeota bacterium]|nr:response regulator transcription factor [Candidatus Dormibacteraeota bacterium]